MKGNNVFQFNEATIVEAMQMYLDAQFDAGAAPEVTSVRFSNEGGGKTFEVWVSEREQA